MKTASLMLLLVLCISLTGCGLLTSGSHVYVAEHTPPAAPGSSQTVYVQNYEQLYDALASMLENGETQQLFLVAGYDQQQLAQDLAVIEADLLQSHPVAAYAVRQIQCTLGTVSGNEALSAQVTYLRDVSELRQIVTVADTAAVKECVISALDSIDSGIVLFVERYSSVDLQQLVADYALEHPETVMELPQVTVTTYPETGESRVIEMKFTYNTSRDSLKYMQSQVSPVFRSAVLYVSGDAAAAEKYSQLYSFLMERYDYTLETSVTPSYSLLRHGIGDSRAFATVYAAMCRQAGLECQVIFGTRQGETCYWNIVQLDGIYYHLDLLSLQDGGIFALHTDADLRETGYLWNFDAYPTCGSVPVQDRPVDMREDIFHENLKK